MGTVREDLNKALAEIDKLKTEIEAQRALTTDVKPLRVDVDDLKRFRSWVMGIGAGVGTIIAFFAEGIRKKLGG